MSTKITNAQRTEFLERILRETFEPRFDALQKKIDAAAKAEVERQHPAFVKAHKDEKTRKYMPVSSGSEFWVSKDVRAHKPARWNAVSANRVGQWGVCAKDEGLRRMQFNAIQPAYHGIEFMLESLPELVAEYNALWADFADAQETLTATIYAYSNRVKFEVDFPDLAKYLPKPPKFVGTAVAVQVGDVMQKLAQVGIPPSAKEAQQ